MASRRGMALRTEEAQGRINVALAVLVADHDDLPEQPGRTRDPLLDATLRLEWIADTLERLAGVAEPVQDGTEGPNTGQDTGDDASGAPGATSRVELDRTELKERKLDDLKTLAIDAGVPVEQVAPLRSKDAVLDLFEARINGAATVGDPFSREALLETDLEALQVLAIATGIEDDAVEAAEDDSKEALVALIVEHPRFVQTVEEIDHLDTTIGGLIAALTGDEDEEE